MTLLPFDIRSADALADVFAAMTTNKAQALIVLPAGLRRYSRHIDRTKSERAGRISPALGERILLAGDLAIVRELQVAKYQSDPAEKVGKVATDRGKPDGQPKRAVHNYDRHIGGGTADHG